MSDPLHSHQVADPSMKIAQALGLTAAVVIRCQPAGWRHDAGKVVRNHPLTGEQLVRRIAGLTDAAPVIRHHHERYDGTGYPDGLVGDEIPVEARILGIANAYAALTADRVYAAGVSQDEALRTIEAEAEGQFDPAMSRPCDRSWRPIVPASRPSSPTRMIERPDPPSTPTRNQPIPPP